MALNGQQATTDISPSRFVKKSGAGKVAAVTDGAADISVGISMEGTQDTPIPGASSLAAASGDILKVYGTEDNCLLEAGGTVADGAYVKSDNSGRGVTAAAGDTYYFICERGGAVGQKLQGMFRIGVVPT